MLIKYFVDFSLALYLLCSLVVAIRGTLSLHDMLTDLRGQPGPLLETGEQPDWTGHQVHRCGSRAVFCTVAAGYRERGQVRVPAGGGQPGRGLGCLGYRGHGS